MRLSIGQLFCSVILLMMARPLPAQTQGPQHRGNSARSFVEEFYKWYVPRALNDDSTVGWKNTLKLIRPDISAQLNSLLEDDFAARTNCKEAVGIDFDPFLYTQEPANHYEVGRITQVGEHYRADIYRVELGKRSEKPDVNAEFTRKDDHWFFVNFYYSSTNLLAVLKSRPKCLEPRVPDGK